MDLVQLMFAQPTTQELNLSFEASAERSEVQLGDAFMSLMENLLIDEESSLPLITNASQEVGKEELPELISEDIPMPVQPISQVEEEKAEVELTGAEQDELTASIKEPFQLAWFDAESFEPPMTNKRNSSQSLTEDENLSSEIISLNPPMAALLQPRLDVQLEDNLAKEELGSKVLAENLNTSLVELDSSLKVDEAASEPESLEPSLNAASNKAPQLQTVFDGLASSRDTTKHEKPVLGETVSFIDAGEKLLDLKSVSNLILESSSEDFSSLNELLADTKATEMLQPIAVQREDRAPATDPSAVSKMIELKQAISEPDWSEHFNQQILWLGQQKINTAVIKLHPEELGPLEVNIKLVKDDASLNITTHSLEVRDIIEEAIPRLRDLMFEQGVNLAQVNIESNANQRQPHSQAQQWNSDWRKHAESTEGEVIQQPQIIKRTKGLIDYFA